MIRFIGWLMLGLLCGVAYSQPTTFDTLYTQGHIGYALMPSGQGYAIAGDHHNGEFWLFEVDAQGRLLWERTYGRRHGMSDISFMQDAEISSDGNYFIAGWSFSIPEINWGKNFGYVVKADSLGNQIWDYLAYHGYDSSRHSEFYNVTPTPDGGCLLSGSVIMNPDHSVPSDTRFWIVKLNSLGQVEFDKIYRNGPANATFDTGISDAVVLPQGQGYLIGTTFGFGQQGYLMLLDLAGDTVWTRKYDQLPGTPSGLVMVRDIDLAETGDYLLAMGAYLALVDTLGDVIWAADELKSRRINALPSGNLFGAFVGYIQSMTADGQFLWQRDYTDYGLDPVDFIRFVEVVPAQDGGLMVLYNSLSGLGLMKTDCEGNLVNPVACATTSVAQASALPRTLEIAYLSDRWRVSYESATRNGQFELCNLMGQVLESQTLVPAQSTIDWPHVHLAPGLYLLQLRDGQGRLLGSQKVIKY